MTHSFLFSSLVCPLNSSLIHLTAYLWADIPQQLKLNKHIHQLSPFLQTCSSSFTLSFGEWYLTSNSSYRTETWTLSLNPFIASHSDLLLLSSRILWTSTSLLPLVCTCFGPASALSRTLQEPSTHLPASPSQHGLQWGFSAVSESISWFNKNHSLVLRQEAQSPQSSFPPANKPSDFLLVLTLVSLLPRASLVAQTVKNPPALRETWVRSLGWEDSLEEGMATHSGILVWRIAMDRGACWATVQRVAESRIWLKRLSTVPS